MDGKILKQCQKLMCFIYLFIYFFFGGGLLDMIMCIMMPQVHDGDCYLLALDLLQQHAATLGAAAIAVTCLMVSSLPIMVFMNMYLMVFSFL